MASRSYLQVVRSCHIPTDIKVHLLIRLTATNHFRRHKSPTNRCPSILHPPPNIQTPGLPNTTTNGITSYERVPKPLPPANRTGSVPPQARSAVKCASEQCCLYLDHVTAIDQYPQSEHVDPSANAACMNVTQTPKTRERKRDIAKRLMTTKGPRLIGAAATIGLFIFNVVSCCG